MARERLFRSLSRQSTAVERILRGWCYRDAPPTYEKVWRLANWLLLVFGLLAVIGWVACSRSANSWKRHEMNDACAWIKSDVAVTVPAVCLPPFVKSSITDVAGRGEAAGGTDGK